MPWQFIKGHIILKVYKCINCAMAFSWSEDLNVHQRIHTGIYTKERLCKVCSKQGTIG